jgi:hypothetical protein
VAEETKVYLDHLIPRESLRFHRPIEPFVSTKLNKPARLELVDLMGDSQRFRFIRKPDFQRSTWAWTPEECVQLLESFRFGQVIPSIIMWTSPDNGYEYILDGGHRVSVVLAWLSNRWGRQIADFAPFIDDYETRQKITRAADSVERLVAARIGTIQSYQDASTRLAELVTQGNVVPKEMMPDDEFQRALFYQGIVSRSVAFHVLWVDGDYKTAERSFLKINKSGRQLSDWETRIVQDRDSSFMRCVMSTANPTAARHYWPQDADLNDSQKQTAKSMEMMSTLLNNNLFHPAVSVPVKQLTLPFMMSSPSEKTRWISEFLTVTAGYRGQQAETDKLISETRRSDASDFLQDGSAIMERALELFEHLNGPNTQSKSLGIVPALYFYTVDARYVRSLFYGFVYWMTFGAEADFRLRKLMFSAYRGEFEAVLKSNKASIVEFISRNRGSGPEVTITTANVLDTILRALVRFKSPASDNFIRHIREQLRLDLRIAEPEIEENEEDDEDDLFEQRRQITPRERSQAVLSKLIDRAITCEICGGIIDPASGIQFDHVILYSQGGSSTLDNSRVTHPYCNNNRSRIEEIRGEALSAAVPRFTKQFKDPKYPRQLEMFPDSYYTADD